MPLQLSEFLFNVDLADILAVSSIGLLLSDIILQPYSADTVSVYVCVCVAVLCTLSVTSS